MKKLKYILNKVETIKFLSLVVKKPWYTGHCIDHFREGNEQ